MSTNVITDSNFKHQRLNAINICCYYVWVFTNRKSYTPKIHFIHQYDNTKKWFKFNVNIFDEDKSVTRTTFNFYFMCLIDTVTSRFTHKLIDNKYNVIMGSRSLDSTWYCVCQSDTDLQHMCAMCVLNILIKRTNTDLRWA